MDAHWAGSLQVAQKAPCVSRGFCVENANEHLPCRPIDGHEEVTAAAFIGYLG